MTKATKLLILALLAFVALVPAVSAQTRQSIKPTDRANPLREIISGYYFTSLATRALQDDDFDNPSSLWLDEGAAIWSRADGEAAKSCSSCHGDAKDSMKGVGTRYPAFDKGAKTVINLGFIFNLLGIAFLVMSSKIVRTWFHKLRRRNKWIDDRVSDVEPHLPDDMRDALTPDPQTGPAADTGPDQK